MKDLKINIPLVSYGYGPIELSWRENVKDAGLYMISDTQLDPENTKWGDRIIGTPADFVRTYNKMFGYVPGHSEANSAGCGLAFQLAIEKAGSLDPEKVRDALANLDEMTFLGRLKFDKDGSRLGQPQYAVQVQNPDPNVKPVIVYPFQYAKAKLIYPAIPWDKR
jgi:branched-chain amino acid transport system substrate-binding protein